MADEGKQEHPISIYLWIWLLLFVFSFFSYMVDYMNFQGFWRWSLILVFMFLKDIHAHGLGTPGAQGGHPRAPGSPVGACVADGLRSRLHVPDPDSLFW
jgi:hypothetical protein